MIDCVLGYHLNPLTCGIAKFNSELARRLGVPILSVFDPEVAKYKAPLLSIKIAEFSDGHVTDLHGFIDSLQPEQSLRLFYHDYSATPVEDRMIQRAAAVYCGNAELVDKIKGVSDNAIEAWCPGILSNARRIEKPEISVLSFGMAHKIRSSHYKKLDQLLRQTGKSYALYLSTALHEGTTFEDDFSDSYEEIHDVFGGEIFFLGYLSDTAVYNYLVDTTFFAAFFGSGVRANNTSVHTAMHYGATVITNLDDVSPACYTHMKSIVDINQCTDLPVDEGVLSQIGTAAVTAAAELGWDPLIEHMRRFQG